MNGFGLYETLRLLVPGAIAVAVITTVLRLATGEGPLLAGGPFAESIGALQGATFLFASLVVGFLLYLVDLPTRARLFRGDPANEIILPTDKMKAILAESPHKSRSFSLYFTISDSRMPPEMHRRVYFFGGMYRIYFDARVLTAAGLAMGAPLALSNSQLLHSPRAVSSAHILAALAVAAVVALVILAGEARHGRESINKRRSSRATEEERAQASVKHYFRRSLRGVGAVLPAAAVVAILSILGWQTLMLDGQRWDWAGYLCSGLAFGLWLAVEFGPPEVATDPDKIPTEPLRRGILRAVNLKPQKRAQYSQLQRGLMDLALFVPALLALGCAAQLQGRPPEMVALWAVLALPASLIMSVRKHEQRLVNTYNDQVAWLEVHEARILEIVDDSTTPPREWC